MQKINFRTSFFLAIIFAFTLLAFAPKAYAYETITTYCNNGHGYLSADYLCIHETANPGASAKNHNSLYSRGYKYAVHYVMELDGSTVYHCMKDNRKSWSVGNGNSHVISIELCHATNKSQFNAQWEQAVQWAADYLRSKSWGIDRLISHNDARLKWGGTDHTDPNSYFSSYGKSWAQFKAAVGAKLNGTNKATPSAKDSGSTTTAKYTPGKYKFTTNVKIRSGAGTNYAKVGLYRKGSTVNISNVTYTNGYYWGSYIAYSGKTRYVALGTLSKGYAQRCDTIG